MTCCMGFRTYAVGGLYRQVDACVQDTRSDFMFPRQTLTTQKAPPVENGNHKDPMGVLKAWICQSPHYNFVFNFGLHTFGQNTTF